MTYMVNLTFIWSFSRISWVDNVKLATINSFRADSSSVSPSSERLEKLWVVCVFAVFTRFKRRSREFTVLKLWVVCVFAVITRFKRHSREFMVLEKCGVMFMGQTHISKGNFPFNLDNTLSIVQFPFWNKFGHSEWCFSRDRVGTTSFSFIALT